jgi:hypothetical protein
MVIQAAKNMCVLFVKLEEELFHALLTNYKNRC